MISIPYARIKEFSHEIVEAECPHPECHHYNIFNRRTDLEDLKSISFKEVKCLKCGEPFNINGDLCNPLWEMLILECFDLKREKKYRHCILNLTQAFEVFFSLYLRVKFLYKPFCFDHDTDKLNELSGLLYETTKKCSYWKLRNIFIHCLLTEPSINNLSEAESFILKLRDLCKDPSDEAIQKFPNSKIRDSLKLLKDSKVAEIRNKVVHQQVYRPTQGEVESSQDETEDILYVLNQYLGYMYDDPNYYLTNTN